MCVFPYKFHVCMYLICTTHGSLPSRDISGSAEVSQIRNMSCRDVKEGLEEVRGLTQKCETSVLGRKKKDGLKKELL